MIVKENINLVKIESYSVGSYILRFFMIILFSLICFIVLRTDQDPITSFIASTIAFLLITVFSTLILLKSHKWVWFFILAYIVKILVGLFHYLYFIDPEYFQTGLYKPLTWEFEAVFDGILSFAHEKKDYGILYYKARENDVTHQEILSLISIPFVYFGDYVMTISPINTFSSLLISMNIMLISKHKFCFDNTRLKYIAITTAYFPMTLISSLLYRDIVGLAAISVGFVLVMFSRKKIVTYLMLLVACYLFYLQRTIYPVILLLSFIINSIFFQKSNKKNTELFYKIITIVLSFIIFPIILHYSNTEANEVMASGAINFNYLFLPLKIIIGLVGPFPWNQFLMYEIIPAYAYQLGDYLQGTLNVAVVITIIRYRKKFFSKNNFNLLNIAGIIIILSGLFNSFMHMTYVAIGFVFLLPWLFYYINLEEFKKKYVCVFLVILFMSILISVFFGNLGLKTLLL